MRVAGVLLWISLGSSLALAAPKDELLVGAAVSLRDALTEAGPLWTAAGPNRPTVRFDFAASSTIGHQIESHAPLDVFFSADEANMDQLAKAGLIAAGTRVDVVANNLVLVVPADTAPAAVKTLEDLKSPKIRFLALCAAAVPVGHYGHAVLEKVGLAEVLAPKIVQPSDAHAALAMVASGAADAGFVYATDAETMKGKVRVAWTAGAADGVDVRYPAAVVADTKKPREAAEFVKWLLTPEAQAVFSKLGFLAR